MTLDPISSTPIASAVAAQQLQTMLEAQVSMLKEVADQQALVSQLLADPDRGQTLDIRA
jgi:hypothetical protein